jgi:hypothetical protein
VLVAEAQRNPFTSAKELKAATYFHRQKSTGILRLKKLVSEHNMLQ